MQEERLFSRLIRFEIHCSRELLDSMKELPETGQHAFKLYAHVLESQLIWLARLAGESEDGEKWWPSVGYEGCRDLLSRTQSNWTGFISTLTPGVLDRKVSYNARGGAHSTVIVRDILFQLFVHAAHIRGQIALTLKEHGLASPLPNYLGFSRLDDG